MTFKSVFLAILMLAQLTSGAVRANEIIEIQPRPQPQWLLRITPIDELLLKLEICHEGTCRALGKQDGIFSRSALKQSQMAFERRGQSGRLLKRCLLGLGTVCIVALVGDMVALELGHPPPKWITENVNWPVMLSFASLLGAASVNPHANFRIASALGRVLGEPGDALFADQFNTFLRDLETGANRSCQF